jgi:hypothetical protein
MTVEEKIRAYRRLDAAFGQLETLLRIEDEFSRLRADQFALERATLQSRTFLIALAIVGGLPTLIAVLPGWWALAALLLVIWAIAYACKLKGQWSHHRKMEQMLEERSPREPGLPFEKQPYVMLSLISSFGTRLSEVVSILNDDLDQTARAKFEEAKTWFEEQLNAEFVKAEELYRSKAISEQDWTRIRSWYGLAIGQLDSEKEGNESSEKEKGHEEENREEEKSHEDTGHEKDQKTTPPDRPAN